MKSKDAATIEEKQSGLTKKNNLHVVSIIESGSCFSVNTQQK